MRCCEIWCRDGECVGVEWGWEFEEGGDLCDATRLAATTLHRILDNTNSKWISDVCACFSRFCVHTFANWAAWSFSQTLELAKKMAPGFFRFPAFVKTSLPLSSPITSNLLARFIQAIFPCWTVRSVMGYHIGVLTYPWECYEHSTAIPIHKIKLHSNTPIA